jgi:hypothetical protein
VDADGLLVVLPRKRGEGGGGDIEIVVALREDDMRELEGDEVFGEFAKGWHLLSQGEGGPMIVRC